MKKKTSSEPLVAILFEAGLTDEIIREIVLRGEDQRDRATAFDAPSRAGFDCWAEKVRAARELLVPLGWKWSDDHNLSVVTTSCGRHAIAMVSGDPFTGRTDHTPQPKYARGDATHYAIERSQLSLFGTGAESRRGGPLLWFLLVHRDLELGHVQVELSLPESITEAGFVSTWRERYVLENIDLNPTPAASTPDHAAPVVVEVRRKR